MTQYVIASGTVSPESYAVYQYGFQIGLEMLTCFAVCFGVSVFLHMVPEFIVSASIFMLLRSFAGGFHLHTFWGCFICSVSVQTLLLVIGKKSIWPTGVSWSIILISAFLIWKQAPVETWSRRLDITERQHCKRVTFRLLVGIVCFAGFCTVMWNVKFVSLIAMTMEVILVSQCVGIIKLKNEGEGDNRE